MALDIGTLQLAVEVNTSALKEASSAFNKLEPVIERLAQSLDKLTNVFSSTASASERAYKEMTAAADRAAREEASIQKARIQQAIATNKAMTAAESAIQKSAKESAKVFEEAFLIEEAIGRKVVNVTNELGNSFINAGAKAKGASNHLSATTSRTRAVGIAAQNAAYQFQDMIVQMDLGVETSRILGQQLPQLLGGFGKWGAIAGVVAAALAFLIPKIFDSGDEAEKTAKKIDYYKNSLDELNKITEKYEESQAKLNGTLSSFNIRTFTKAVDETHKAFKNNVEEIGALSKVWRILTGDFAESFKQYTDAKKNLSEVQETVQETTLNNLQAQLNETKSIIELHGQYKKGLISLKEYNIQKKLIEETNRRGLQNNPKALKLLEEEIRLRAELDAPKKTKSKSIDVSFEVNALKDALDQANARLLLLRNQGVNAANDINVAFSRVEAVEKFRHSLRGISNEEASSFEKLLGIANGAGKELKDRVELIAQAMGGLKIQTDDAARSAQFLSSLLKDTKQLKDNLDISSGTSSWDRFFNPEVTARAEELNKKALQIKNTLEDQQGTNPSVITDFIKEYRDVAEKAGLVDPFAGIDPTNVQAIAEAAARVNQHISDIPKAMTPIEKMYGDLRAASDSWSKAATDSVADFVKTGKADFSDFAKSVITDLIKITIQRNIMDQAFGVGGGNGLFGGFLKSFANIGQAKGGAWNNGVQAFAKGGSFTNSIVSKPTLFPFAKGTGLMGEAGPEAIMPLTRTSSGDLGVRVEGAGGGGVQINIAVDAKGTSVEGNDNKSNQLGRMIGEAVRSILVSEKRPGGLLHG